MSPTATRVLAQIKLRTGTAMEIAGRIPACHWNVKKILNAMHAAHEAHICGWRRGVRGPITPIYALGEGKDYRKPKPISAAARCKRYRERLQAEFGEQYPEIRKAQRAKVPGRQIFIDGVVAYQQ